MKINVCYKQTCLYVVVQFFLNWYRIHWTGTIVIALVYFYKQSKKGSFLFLGWAKKEHDIAFFPPTFIPLPPTFLPLPHLPITSIFPLIFQVVPSLHTLIPIPSTTHYTILKTFRFTYLILKLNSYHTSTSYQLAMIIYNEILYYSSQATLHTNLKKS